ncbi:Ferulic acid decarboxylase 1 [Kalmusia sp. IMI 367209]|nr:Ferulic acid decarboxylase 1 [Kalmusia sp. IMI 367209]
MAPRSGKVDIVSEQLEPHLKIRSFVEALKRDDDLVEINDGVDPHLEVTAIIRKVCETNDKTPLFNNVKGAKNGLWRILEAPASLRNYFEEICGRIVSPARTAPIEPRIVETGPCKENILSKSEFDFKELPAPLLHQSDGGRYVQTYGMHAVQSPDET